MRRAAALLSMLLAAGCALGPDYKRPAAPTPTDYKEAIGWQPAAPALAASHQPWWAIYDDPVLDGLERQVVVSNQTLKANEAAVRQARATVAAARAGLFPTLALDASARRIGGSSGGSSGNIGTGVSGGGGGGSFGGGSSSRMRYDVSLAADWDLDLWGRVRRTVESDVAAAQASEADLAAARLSIQGEVASNYFSLRALDAQKRILDEAVRAYTDSLRIARNQYRAGIVARGDMVTAETQLRQTQAQAVALGVQRAQFEHAIAVLIGRPPAEFALEPAPLAANVPVVPAGVPSTLLQRRPDIAAAERRVAAANAQIGVAEAALFPSLTLSYTGLPFGHLIDAVNNGWSIGASAAQALFRGGELRAAVSGARAAYDQTVAEYRQTALTAFQDVEDQLAALRVLESQAEIQQQALLSAREAQRLELNQYRAGTVPYTSVLTAQQVALSNEQTALGIQESRLLASVALVQALGGGWQAPSEPATRAASATILPSGFVLP